MSTSYLWGVAVGVIVGVIIVALIFTYNKKKTGSVVGGDFDERQQLLRGKAFQAGFFTMLILSFLYWVLVRLVLQRPLMEDGLSALICVLVGVGVFGFDCILHDAFFTVQNKPKNYIILFIATTICQIPSAINNIQKGRVVENGVLTFGVIPIVCAVLFLGILTQRHALYLEELVKQMICFRIFSVCSLALFQSECIQVPVAIRTI